MAFARLHIHFQDLGIIFLALHEYQNMLANFWSDEAVTNMGGAVSTVCVVINIGVVVWDVFGADGLVGKIFGAVVVVRLISSINRRIRMSTYMHGINYNAGGINYNENARSSYVVQREVPRAVVVKTRSC